MEQNSFFQANTGSFKHLYPFTSRYHTIDGHRMHYVDEGKGKPVIMIHGNPTWSFYFRTLISGLKDEYRAIAPDHIGCGLSDRPGTRSYDYTLQSRVRDLDAFIDHLGLIDKITLVVHDWGGMIGLAWAVDHPEQIDRLVITNTSGFFLPGDKSLPLSLWMVKYLPFFAVPAVLGLNLFALGAAYMCTERRLDKDVKKGLLAPYNSWKNRIAVLRFVQDIPLSSRDRSFGIVHHVDTSLSRLSDIPMLFLWGAKDFVFDTGFLDEFRRRFPWSKTHVFHDAGHYLFEDKPFETLDIVRRFLS